MARLETANDLADTDLTTRPGEPEPAAGSSLCDDEAGLRKIPHDLHQMMPRDRELASHLVRREGTVGLARKSHERTQSKVREGRETHRRSHPNTY